jgi:glycosyltransferase involved in cell wall biosynthesis
MTDIVVVNSEWSKRALVLQGVPAEKIIVVPLCIDLCHWTPGQPIDARGPLKVLWLGGINLRKGIQYLVGAARLLQRESIEFHLAGPIYIAESVVKTFPPNMRILGRLTRDQTDQVYLRSHVFVLPTISDGFAITQLEAMEHGLPVVTTPNCGRVITDGVNGLIVPARDSEALARALARLNADRALVRELSRNALETVRDYDLPANALLIQTQVKRFRENENQPPRFNQKGPRQ